MNEERHENLKNEILNAGCLTDFKGLHLIAKSIVYLADSLRNEKTKIVNVSDVINDGTKEGYRW